jgi:hypothetical protein
MNKTFVFELVWGSYEASMWTVVADTYEAALDLIRKNNEDSGNDGQYLSPTYNNSRINGINYNALEDLHPRVIAGESYYLKYPQHTFSGSFLRTSYEGWWQVSEIETSLPSGFVHNVSHDG